jgi:uncharacterized protein (TIGR02466 family)
MPVEGWFSTPIYYNMIDNVEVIQQELLHAYTEVKKQNKFGRSYFFENSNHTVSDPTFSTDIIKKYKLVNFKKELFVNVYKYLDDVYGPNFPNKFKVHASWFTNTEKGQYARNHDHGFSDLSGVYYLKTNELDGNLILTNPCKQHNMTKIFKPEKVIGTVEYAPKEGLIVLWPGWLEHNTKENKTENTRVSLSFNIIFDWY